MAARLGFILLLAVLVVAALGLLEVFPLGAWLGLGDRARNEGESEATLGDSDADGEAARLAGRAEDAARESRHGAAAVVPVVPPEAQGTGEAGGGIRGRVVRAPGEIPVEGARVALVRPDPLLAYLRGSRAGRHDRLEVKTGKDGRFAFTSLLPAQGYVVRASLPPGPVVTSPEIDLRGRMTKDVGDLVLGAAGSLEGRVVDATGTPVPDARVAVSWPVRNDLDIVLADPDTLEEIEREGRTKADGTFLVEALEPGRKTVIVASPTAGVEVHQNLTIVAGEPTKFGDVVLAGTSFLAGRIENEDGSAIPGARVFSVVMGQGVVRTAESGADGRFRIEHVPEGNYRIGVLVPGLPAKVTQEEHAAGSEDIVVRFPTTGRIEGRVVAKGSGVAVRRFTVRIEGGQMNMVEQFVRRLMDRTLGGAPIQDPEGRFVIERAIPGSTRVIVAADGFPETKSEPFDVVATQTATVRVEMPAGNGAKGIVRGAGGEPASGAEIYVASTKDVVRQESEGSVTEWEFDRPPDTVADAEGRFTLPPQTPGVYDVTATAPKRLPAVVKVDLTGPSAAEVEIRLPPSGRLEGRLLDDGGEPVPHGMVVIWYADGEVAGARSDEKGNYEVDPIRPGRAVVRWRSLRDARDVFEQEPETDAARSARYEALRREGGEVEFVADRPTRVDVRMPRLVRWTGHLRIGGKATGGPSEGFYTALGGGGGTWVRAEPDGRFSVHVEPGHYLVWVPDVEGDWNTVEVDVPPGSAFNADVGQ